MELNFVCLPGLLHGQTIELINQLLKVRPNNKHLIVFEVEFKSDCWLLSFSNSLIILQSFFKELINSKHFLYFVGVVNEYFYFYKAFALDCLNHLETNIESKYSSESFYLKYLSNAPLDGFRVPDALLRLSIINSEKNKKINSLEFLQKFKEYIKLPINDLVNFDHYIFSSAEFDKQMIFQKNLISKFTQ
ncbi:hypothetical protein ACTFIY_007401 [Dictyostelium cf. discoideum]